MLTPRLSSRKLVPLDGIRGLAIAAVIVHHTCWRIPASNTLQLILNKVYFMGWAGVDLFFVLSGFLITGILLDTREAGNYFQSFYARRALRIFPLYFVFLLVAFTLFPLVIAADWLPAPGDGWLYFSYLTNWLALWKGPWRHSVMAHLWSLAVEEQFYFCWPFVVWAVKPRVLLPALLVGELGVTAGRIFWVLGHGPSQTVNIATVSRMDGLLLGAACAILIRHYRLPQRALPWLPRIAGAGLYAYVLITLRFTGEPDWLFEMAGFTVLAVCFALLILHAVLTEGAKSPLQSLLCWRPLTNVGKYAYGLYVYHVPLLYFGNMWIDRFVPQSIRAQIWFGYASIALLFLASYQVARLSFNYFERYFLNWKDRFAPTDSRPLPAAASEVKA